MIQFFRKIRQKLISDGKTGQYLRYAIGEILLVMIGILLALQVNNWNEKRKSKQVEYTLLTELHKSVQEDIKNIHEVISRNQSYISSAEIALNAIEERQVFSDSVAEHLHRSFKVWRIYIKNSAYNNLKEYGLHVIKNDDTRNSIISVYDARAKFVDQLYQRYDQFLYNVVEPELSERFEIKSIEEDDFGLFPINNKLNFDHHNLRYLLHRSIDLQDQIIRAKQRTLYLFETLQEDLKSEMNARKT